MNPESSAAFPMAGPDTFGLPPKAAPGLVLRRQVRYSTRNLRLVWYGNGGACAQAHTKSAPAFEP